jgi:hypothetical protein
MKKSSSEALYYLLLPFAFYLVLGLTTPSSTVLDTDRATARFNGKLKAFKKEITASTFYQGIFGPEQGKTPSLKIESPNTTISIAQL